VERAVPRLVAAREAVDGFHALIRGRESARLATWLQTALSSPVGAFAQGVADDRYAISAAIALPWSNGQTEGRISRPKTVKRQMGGRANIDLLRARLMPMPQSPASRVRQNRSGTRSRAPSSASEAGAATGRSCCSGTAGASACTARSWGRAAFPWPSPADGTALRLTSAQLSTLWGGIDRRRRAWSSPPARVV